MVFVGFDILNSPNKDNDRLGFPFDCEQMKDEKYLKISRKSRFENITSLTTQQVVQKLQESTIRGDK